MPNGLTRDQLGSPDGYTVVVKPVSELPNWPDTVDVPGGQRSTSRSLREWRDVLARDGGLRDPWGNTHAFDLSPWSDADPETRLVVALTKPRGSDAPKIPTG